METMAQDGLPRRSRAYILRANEGARQDVARQVALTKAGNDDTGGALEFACLSGPDGVSLATHVHHRGHEALLVLEGAIDLSIDGTIVRLEPGDYASIPPGAAHGYRMRGPHTNVAAWTVGGSAGRLYDSLAMSVDQPLPDDADTEWRQHPPTPRPPLSRGLPDDVVPYVLRKGEGEHLAAGLQVFTLLSHQRATGGRFITVATEGATDGRTPRHFHERHTEAFFCLHGRMTMWVDGVEHALTAGDFVHVPPRTVHAYRLDSPRTRFVGVLSPGLFEPFFRALCEPWPSAEPPGVPLPYRFDRVAAATAALDVTFLDPSV